MAPTYPDLIANTPGEKSWLHGKRVLITRPRLRADETARLFTQHGAIAIAAPAIEIGPPSDAHAATRALSSLAEFDWVVFSSANGARAVASLLFAVPSTWPPVAAVGQGTARALEELGIPVALVATEQLAEKLAEELSARLVSLGRPARILVPQGDIARDVLVPSLTERGHNVTPVTVYSTTTESSPGGPGGPLAERLRDGGVDVVTFASPSAVRGTLDRLGASAVSLLLPCVIGSIGPVTTAEANRRGLRVDVTATEHTIEGLIQALEAWGAAHRSEL